jgi:hypothetical protein
MAEILEEKLLKQVDVDFETLLNQPVTGKKVALAC